MSEIEHPVPPAGEDIHLPGPTAKPFLLSIAITLVVIGTTIFPPYLIVLGGVLFLYITYKWIQDVRHDVAELPEEHKH